MGRPKGSFKALPAYRLHKASGQAIVTLGGRDVYLGEHNSPKSHTKYQQEVGRWMQLGRHSGITLDQLKGGGGVAGITITQMIAAFWPHAQRHYKSGGREFRQPLRTLRNQYGDMLARDFGPMALTTLRDRLVASKVTFHINKGPKRFIELDKTLSRRTVNKQVSQIRLVFKWAVSRELVPPSVLHGLEALDPLKRGRSGARETPKKLPVPLADIEALRPYMLSHLWTMVQVLLHTGMRLGELLVMRTGDIDRSDPAAWLYRPSDHKTAHLGIERVIPIGPQAQQAILPFLKLNPHAYVFTPGAAYQAWLDHRREQAKLDPNYLDRERQRRRLEVRRRNRGVRPLKRRERYDCRNIGGLLTSAHVRCNRARAKDGLPPLAYWHMHRLRHNFATMVRAKMSLDDARLLCGHGDIETTKIYAEKDISRMKEVISRVG